MTNESNGSFAFGGLLAGFASQFVRAGRRAEQQKALLAALDEVNKSDAAASLKAKISLSIVRSEARNEYKEFEEELEKLVHRLEFAEKSRISTFGAPDRRRSNSFDFVLRDMRKHHADLFMNNFISEEISSAKNLFLAFALICSMSALVFSLLSVNSSLVVHTVLLALGGIYFLYSVTRFREQRFPKDPDEATTIVRSAAAHYRNDD